LASFDVLIAGAGAAGCACAASLADFAPELRACLVDAPARQPVCMGESVPPQIRPVLEHLRLWSQFSADGHSASHRTISAWGAPHLLTNEFLFHTQQIGWRIDRARFDTMMLQAATERGVPRLREKVVDIARDGDNCRITFGSGTGVTARMVIDATGRGAVLAHRQGLRAMIDDRLIGCVMQFAGPGDDNDGLLIEACPNGWWYSAVIPDGRRIVAFMTDADLVRPRNISSVDGWMRALAETQHVVRTVGGAQHLGPPKLAAAGSRRPPRRAELPLICVGDAASSFDPVSGQGILKALRSGIFASYAAADYLRGGDRDSLARYRAFADAEFSAYRQTLREYYAMEQRWRDHPFWRRRSSGDSHVPERKELADRTGAA
jgi:flavin-dependent dehydrogenase